MPEDHNTTSDSSEQGSDYERSQDLSTTVLEARKALRAGISNFPEKHPVALYLKSRGLWPLLEQERHLLKAQFYVDTKEGFSGHWLAVPLYDDQMNTVAVQRTSINEKGEKVSVGGRNDRITIGEAYDAAIRIGPLAGEVLCVAEGLEDAMSVVRFVKGAVCWAACGRRGMEEMVVPDTVEEVRIYADNDPAGFASAQVLALRMVRTGRKVRIFASPVPGEDPNDILQKQRIPVEPTQGWLGRIAAFCLWRSLSQGEIDDRLLALARSEDMTITAVKSEWKAFVNSSRARRVLVASGVSDSIEKAVANGYRYSREGIKPGDMVNALIALHRIGLTARLDLFDMKLYVEPRFPQSSVVAVPGAPLFGMNGAVVMRDELAPPLLAFIAMRENVTFSEGMLYSTLMAVGHALPRTPLS